MVNKQNKLRASVTLEAVFVISALRIPRNSDIDETCPWESRTPCSKVTVNKLHCRCWWDEIIPCHNCGDDTFIPTEGIWYYEGQEVATHDLTDEVYP